MSETRNLTIFTGRDLRHGFAEQVVKNDSDVLIVNRGIPQAIYRPFGVTEGNFLAALDFPKLTVRDCVKSFGRSRQYIAGLPGRRVALVRYGPGGVWTDWLGILALIDHDEATNLQAKLWDAKSMEKALRLPRSLLSRISE